MATFPTLSIRPKKEEPALVDNTRRHEIESGVVLRRRRYTRDRYVWELSYDLLSAADATLIDDHFAAHSTTVSFAWVDREGVTHTVYYDAPPQSYSPYPGWFKFDTITLKEF